LLSIAVGEGPVSRPGPQSHRARPMVVIPSQMRGLNRRTLFQQLQRVGVASRADLARSLGMSAPTAGKIVEELLELGVLEEVPLPRRSAGAVSGRLGRPGRLVQADRRHPRFLGIELGVTQTRFAALPVGVDGDDAWTVQVPTGGSAEAWRGGLREAAARLAACAWWGVLVSVPGIVDEPAGRILFSPNLHWTEGIDLREVIGEVWRAPVELVQEERALALGHHLAEPEEEDLLLVDFGEGVGGAMLQGGRVPRGASPVSGELGHTPIPGNTRRCGCGGVGCIETLVSRNGLIESHRAERTRWGEDWDGLQAAVAEGGIPGWLAQAMDSMGSIIAGALNVLGLNRLVVTGHLSDLPPVVVEHLSRAVQRGTLWGRFGEVTCRAAVRRRAAGLVAMGIDRLILPVETEGRAGRFGSAGARLWRRSEENVVKNSTDR